MASRAWALPVLGVIVGLAVAGLVRNRHTANTVYHGRYLPLDEVTTSKAYQSTLTLTYDHSGPSALLIGAAIGLLVGVATAVVLGRRDVLSGSWPSGSARR